MKKIIMLVAIFFMADGFAKISETISSTDNNRAYLPLEISGRIFTFSTREIPEGLSVTVICHLPKVNGQRPKSDSYMYVFPHAGKFTSIMGEHYYGPLEIGGKVYKRDCYGHDYLFRVNGVTRNNEAIVIDTRREGRNAVKGYCFY